MSNNTDLIELVFAGAVVLAAAAALFWLLGWSVRPRKNSRYSHSLKSRLMGVVNGRLRELELKSYTELQALPEEQRDDRISPSGRRFYVQTTKEQQPDGTLAVTVEVVEIKPLGLGVRVGETLYASPPPNRETPR